MGEKVGEFTIANIATLVNLEFGEKILANGVRFAKSANIFLRQIIALYGTLQLENFEGSNFRGFRGFFAQPRKFYPRILSKVKN